MRACVRARRRERETHTGTRTSTAFASRVSNVPMADGPKCVIISVGREQSIGEGEEPPVPLHVRVIMRARPKPNTEINVRERVWQRVRDDTFATSTTTNDIPGREAVEYTRQQGLSGGSLLYSLHTRAFDRMRHKEAGLSQGDGQGGTQAKDVTWRCGDPLCRDEHYQSGKRG